MFLRTTSQFQSSFESFNMTPIIDIVFQLIIFFSLVCQFIEAENFPVTVPDNCKFAQRLDESQADMATITVIKKNKGRSDFAVGAEKISASGYIDVVGKVAKLIDVRLANLPSNRRVVTLRIDKDISFGEAQYALAAVASSSATDIKLAALKGKRAESR